MKSLKDTPFTIEEFYKFFSDRISTPNRRAERIVEFCIDTKSDHLYTVKQLADKAFVDPELIIKQLAKRYQRTDDAE